MQAAEKSLADARDEIERLGCAHVGTAVAAATAACEHAQRGAPGITADLSRTLTENAAPQALRLLSDGAPPQAGAAARGAGEAADWAMREIDGNAHGGDWGLVAGRGEKEGGVDVSGAKVRVLECAVGELRAAVEGLRRRLQESAALERRVRELLAEARARERTSAQRLAAEAARVHAVEIMRMNGAAPVQFGACCVFV